MVETVPFLTFLETIGVLAYTDLCAHSMPGMGFSLTVPQILSPLHNLRLVILSLAANFILVPLLAIGILMIFPLSEGLSIGLFLLGLLQEPRSCRSLPGGKRGHCVCCRANGSPVVAWTTFLHKKKILKEKLMKLREKAFGKMPEDLQDLTLKAAALIRLADAH